MYMDPRFMQWIQEIHTTLQWQREKMVALEQMLVQLQQDIAEIKDRNQTQIDKIEYNFDQLKVETLEGTLNIGLTPNGMNQIEDMAVGQLKKDQDPEEAQDGQPDFFYTQIQGQLERYLTNELDKDMAKLEAEYDQKLDDDLKGEITGEIRSQTDFRIHSYMKQLRQGPDSDDKAGKEIIRRVKRDIRLAIRQYFERHYGKDSEADEDESSEQGD